MMETKEFYVVISATGLSDWVKLGHWSDETDPIIGGYHTDYPTFTDAQLALDNCLFNPHAEILVFSQDKPYPLLRRVKKNGDVINC